MAFDFPNPPTAEPVTNPATGVTYQYDAASQTWIVVSSAAADSLGGTLDDLKDDVESLQSLLPLETQARQQGDAALQGQIDTLNAAPEAVTYQIQTDKVLRSGEPAIELVDSEGYYSNVKFEATGGLTVSSSASSIIIDGSGIDAGGDVNLDNYYTKDEIDNQFTLRGIGYNYFLSNVNGSATIRAGELNTNNRLAGQVTFISLGETDDQGKIRRNAIVGDTIDLFDAVQQKFYRYLITAGADGTYSVTYEGSEADRNDPFGIGFPFTVYLYPTHISAANYYDKTAADERFMQLGVGSTQYCNRITEFNQTVKYNGAIGSSKSITTKQYVDTAIAGLASVQYVNDEVDKLSTSFSLETSEPDIFYGDYAPQGTRKDGDIWFDSMHLRLNIWSQGAWINPDRNDGASLENRITALEARLAQLEGN